MAVTIYTGSSGSGKTYAVLKDVIRRSLEEPFRKFFVIVPEQFTMQTQQLLVNLHPRKAILNLDVTSLNRLAYRVFSETGTRSEKLLEEIGKSFLIEKAAIEHQKELRYFSGNLTRPENVAEMKAMISELMIYGISPEGLRAAAQSERSTQLLSLKLADIALIYEAFLKKLAKNYLTVEEVPERLAGVSEKSGLLRGSVLVFDGFTGFTPVQLLLLEKLLPLVSDLYITLTADPGINLFETYTKQDLFVLSYDTAHELLEMSNRTGVPMNPPVVVSESEKSRHARSKAMSHLERNLFRRRVRIFSENQTDIRMICAQNPRAETEEAAREIRRLVREEGFRYREIAVVTGDLETYGGYAREVMAEYDIPCFIDEKRKLLHNPFIEYLRAALEAVSENYSYEAMFRLLKCGMAGFDREAVSRLENYVLGCGIRGKKAWREEFIRHYRDENPAEVPVLNALRKEITELLDPLTKVFSVRGSTVREKTEALYDFCMQSGAEQKLRLRAKTLEEAGKPELAREYEQVWPYVMGFLDKLVALLGEEKLSMKDYAALIEAGFAEARVAVIPPGNDRVLVGDVERSRIPEIRVLIFLGMNEGIVPKPPKAGGMLTDADRNQLEEKEIRLKPTVRQSIYIDRFYLYLALTKPSERLYISFAQGNARGEAAQPAYVIDAVSRLFGGISAELPTEELGERLETEKGGLTLLAEGIRKLGEADLGTAYRELFSYYRNHSEYFSEIERLLRAAGRKKPVDEIGRAAARVLYGDTLTNSATRLESFCACEFRHFLVYGLKLRERPSYEFSGLERGTILHRAFELYAGRLLEEHSDERQEKERLYAAAETAFSEAVAEEGIDSVLYSDARSRYEIRRMRRLLLAAVDMLSEQAQAGAFDLYEAEQGFRGASLRTGFEFELPDGVKMYLNGKIDRIDTCKSGDMTYVRIIDYKTGSTRYDLKRIYYGLQLQLALYMNASLELLRQRGKNPVPAGMLYFPVTDPMLDAVQGESPEDCRRRRLKKMQPTGVVNSSPEVLQLLDAGTKNSDPVVIPVKIKKNGDIGANSSVLDSGGFAMVGKYAMRKAQKTGEAIMNGCADVNPYSFGKSENACMYCAYRTVCGFDRRIPGYRFRELEKGEEDQAILEKMDRELNS